jgi:signal recognition particle subunit SRP54
VKRVTAAAVGDAVVKSVQPGQQIIKVVHDELVAMLGPVDHSLPHGDKRPGIIMLVGLQGSGKTTSAAKLANLIRKKGRRPLLVAADVRRPAAVEQLQTLGASLDVPVYAQPGGDPPRICADGIAAAMADSRDLVILDTGGRLHIDDTLMRELEQIKTAVAPDRIYFVADAMTGQDAVTSAEQFHARLQLSGVVLTKMDGDARGGAALSIRAVTGAPVVYVGVGEKADALEEFHPDRVAGRILGMGDVVSLVEKAQEAIKEEDALALQEKMMAGTLNMEDFLILQEQFAKLGSMRQVVGMMPGLGQMAGQLEGLDDPKLMHRPRAIILSMTPAERKDPDLIDANRRRRIARGSGTSVADVNQLVKGFKQVQTVMQQLTDGSGMMGMLGRHQLKKIKKRSKKRF